MDFFLLIGIILGFIAITVGMVLKGASIAVLLNPEAMIVIFVGIIAAVINSYPSSELKKVPKMLLILIKTKKFDNQKLISEIVDLSNIARRDGLLALESQREGLDDPFLERGLEMVIDGLEEKQIREIMENEIEGMDERHRKSAGIFKTAGTTSPTLGVMGAVIGLIGALGNLNNVNALGTSISSAFVATLYGIFFGYVILIPFNSRLLVKSEKEIEHLTLVLEGVIAIQSGASASSIEKKLYSLTSEKKSNNKKDSADEKTKEE
ncbi:flagellar motor stator protein MotA [Liquorilactobacillus mali]|nr:flagellar motor stator protein MotA [Liquorilactobacillus mali]